MQWAILTQKSIWSWQIAWAAKQRISLSITDYRLYRFCYRDWPEGPMEILTLFTLTTLSVSFHCHIQLIYVLWRVLLDSLYALFCVCIRAFRLAVRSILVLSILSFTRHKSKWDLGLSACPFPLFYSWFWGKCGHFSFNKMHVAWPPSSSLNIIPSPIFSPFKEKPLKQALKPTSLTTECKEHLMIVQKYVLAAASYSMLAYRRDSTQQIWQLLCCQMDVWCVQRHTHSLFQLFAVVLYNRLHVF